MKFYLYKYIQKEDAFLRYLHEADWKAGNLLYRTLKDGTFHTRFGQTAELYFLLDGEQIVGFGAIVEQDFFPIPEIKRFLAFLYVDHAYRGRYLSRKIIRHLEETVLSRGETEVHILTQHKGLYEKMNYALVREVEDGVHEHAYLYTKNL